VKINYHFARHAMKIAIKDEIAQRGKPNED
jgi:hypothetical protein